MSPRYTHKIMIGAYYMFILKIKLSTAEDVTYVRNKVIEHSKNIHMVIVNGSTIALPAITCTPYITPLDNLEIRYKGTLPEFMNLIRDLYEYIDVEQNALIRTIIDSCQIEDTV